MVAHSQTTPLTEEKLQAIAARLAACTPGPWYHRALGFVETGSDPSQAIGVMCQRHDPRLAELPAAENAEFIAHAREDVPQLLDEVRRLRDRVRQLEAALVQPEEATAYRVASADR